MIGRIVYFQQDFPKLTETFILAEIEELLRRGYDVKVLVCRPDDKLLANTLVRDHIVTLEELSAEALLASITALSPSYIHIHWVTEAKRIIMPIAEHLGIPFGFTAHAADLWKRGNRLEPEELQVVGNHRLCRTAAVEGTAHRDYLRYCSVPEEKIIITPNSVDSRNLPPCETKESCTQLVCVGRPVAKKGFLVAVDAVRMLRMLGHQVSLCIVGGGDTSTALGVSLSQYVRSFDFISVTELCAHHDALKKIAASDLLVVPSMIAEDGDSDGLPTVIVEAMLMGVPVVASDVASIRDILIDEGTGFMSRPGDAASLVEAILKAISLYEDPKKVLQLIELAKRRALRHETQSSVNVLVEHLARAC